MSVRTPRLARATGIVLIAAWLPLILYIPFDFLRGGGGNPIGLGLLAFAGTAVCGLLLAAQVLIRMFGQPPSR